MATFRSRSCLHVQVLLFLLSIAARCPSQVLVVDFEPPVWPLAATNYLYTTPSTWSRTITSGATTVSFDFRNIGLWGNESNDAVATYFGSQAARCRYPQASAGVTGDSVMAARGVVDPRGVAFKLASTGVSTLFSDSRHWVLEFWTVSISGPRAGQSQWHAAWSSLRGDLDRGRYYVREAVDLSSLPNGVYDIEWRVTQHADTGATFEVLLDDVEIYMGNSAVPPKPMPLDLLEPLIDAVPPVAAPEHENRQQRSWMMRDLDRHAVAYHADHYMIGDRQTRTPFTEFFRSRTRKVIQEVATTVPDDDEVLVWKLYSSGYVVKSPKYTFGFDIQEGPNPNGRVSAASMEMAMGLTDDDADALAAVLDFTFHSHYHHDHVNFDFVARMIAAGKRVFGPSGVDPNDPFDLREYYATYGDGTYDAQAAMIENPAAFGPLPVRLPDLDIEVCTYKAVQSSVSVLAPTIPIPPALPTDPINYSYLVTTENGVSLLVMGDVRQALSSSPAVAALDPVLDWFAFLKSQGRRIDIKLGAGPLIDSGVWRNALIENFKPLIRMHGHEWEMNHPTVNLLTRTWSDSPPTDESAFPCSVGECFRFKRFPVQPQVDPATLTTSGATVVFETTHTVRATVRYGTAADFQLGAYPYSVTESTPTRQHAIALGNLSSGTTYYFHVVTAPDDRPHGFGDTNFRFTTR